MKNIILAIESSCDDTSAAICIDGKVVSNVTAGQKIHEKFGGVVPELASRAHLQNIIPTVEVAIQNAGISKKEINAVAFTRGPGLIGSLLVGTSFAKGFALAHHLPLIEVNHMQAHILANFIDEPIPRFPCLCLTVSGGHTQIVLVKDYLDMEVIGTTIDDAAGEAFDKTAKVLNLPYPGGPFIDKYAQNGNPHAYSFTKPKIENLDFSFSGLKTSILYFIQKKLKENPHFIEENIQDICASVQYTIIEILAEKIILAAKKYAINEICIAGGVSMNSGLRNKMQELSTSKKWNVYIPQFQYCTDNAGMIAIAGYHKFLKKEFAFQNIMPTARLHI